MGFVNRTPQTPNRVAGVANTSTDTSATPPIGKSDSPKTENAAEQPVEKVKYPVKMVNGDILHDIIEHGRHRIEIIEKTDPSQYVKFHGLCSCGVQGRFHTKQGLINYMDVHLGRSDNRH